MDMWAIIISGVTLLFSSSVLVEIIRTKREKKQYERERSDKKADKKESERDEILEQMRQMVVLLGDLKRSMDDVAGNQAHISDGLRVLLVDKIEHFGRKYIENNEITFEEREVLKKIHAAAHELGCNGSLDEIMEKTLSLKVVKTDERRKNNEKN